MGVLIELPKGPIVLMPALPTTGLGWIIRHNVYLLALGGLPAGAALALVRFVWVSGRKDRVNIPLRDDALVILSADEAERVHAAPVNAFSAEYTAARFTTAWVLCCSFLYLLITSAIIGISAGRSVPYVRVVVHTPLCADCDVWLLGSDDARYAFLVRGQHNGERAIVIIQRFDVNSLTILRFENLYQRLFG
jgi:hypothetical protein